MIIALSIGLILCLCAIVWLSLTLNEMAKVVTQALDTAAEAYALADVAGYWATDAHFRNEPIEIELVEF